jgi:PAS domain S-box-containing protein
MISFLSEVNMIDSSSKATSPSQTSISALREAVKNLTHLIAQRPKGQVLQAEFAQHAAMVQDLLAKLEQQLSAQASERDELDALFDICQVISSSLDVTEVLTEVMDQIIRLTGAERSFLMLLDPSTGELEFRTARNMDRETIDSSSFEISRSVVTQVATSGEPVVTTNAQMDPRFKAHESVIGYNLRSILCVPLRARGRVTGVIYADNRILSGLFSDRDRDLLAAFAGQAAIAIENARLFQSVNDAKALMDNVFASITSGVITTDVEEHITLFNRASERVFRVPATTIVGSCFSDALPALAEALAPVVYQVKEQGHSVVEFESEVPLRNSGQLTLRTSLSPLKDANEEAQGITIVIDDITEQRRLESRYQLFRRYLPPAVIERLPDDPHELRLGGQRQEITSLFADIRGFTDFSRQHAPEKLVDVLNQYLAIASDAILAEEGTLDKIMGDCIVAFFNAPLPQQDHVQRAIRAALKIQEGVAQLHQQVSPAYRLDYGVGVNVGDAVVGNVGTAQQMNYTAIGSSINLARRLQEAAAPRQILLSDTAYQRVARYVQAQRLQPIQAAGFNEPITVYELLGLQDQE